MVSIILNGYGESESINYLQLTDSDKNSNDMKDKIIKLLDDWKVNKHKQELMAEELLILCGVVVPKGTLCECKKHSLKTNYGFEVCTKCGNEFDEEDNYEHEWTKLFSEANDYNQPDKAFVHLYWNKPTK